MDAWKTIRYSFPEMGRKTAHLQAALLLFVLGRVNAWGCLRLRGSARAIDIAKLIHDQVMSPGVTDSPDKWEVTKTLVIFAVYRGS